MRKFLALWTVSARLYTSVSLAILISPTLATAQDTLIGFEELAENEIVDHQYQKRGVVFGPPGFLPHGVKVAAGLAQSGTTVASISCGPDCSAEFPTPFATGSFVGSTRKNIKIFAGVFAGQFAQPVQLTLIAKNSDGKIVAQSAATLLTPGAGFHTPLAVQSSSPDIASFEISARPGLDSGSQIAIDDVTVDNPAGLNPDFGVSANPGVSILQATSIQIPIAIQRLNGSSGGVQFSVNGLPAGVTVAFDSNPVAGSSLTLTLKAAADAPSSPVPHSVLLTAAPVGPSVGAVSHSLSLTLVVQANFTVSLAGSPNIRIASCSTVHTLITVLRDFGFTGKVKLTVTGLPPGVIGLFEPSLLEFEDGGLIETSTLTLTAHGPIANTMLPPGIVIASSGNLPESRFALPLQSVAGAIDSFTPTTGRAPQALRAGTEITIKGIGFCQGSTLLFGNLDSNTKPMTIDSDGSTIRGMVPRLATDGPITVLLPDRTPLVSKNSFTVRSYRNTNGFADQNFDIHGVSFDDISELFGYDQTHISIDLCWPFGCDVTLPIPNPLAALFTAIAGAALDDGQCSGFALASQRLLHGDKKLNDFYPPGATSIWQLTGHSGDALPTQESIKEAQKLTHYIHLQHIAQLSSEFLHHWLTNSAFNLTANSAHIRAQVSNGLNSGDHPMISIRSGSSGHMLVAYDIEDDDGGNGGFYIRVYDSNEPFLSTENTDVDLGNAHRRFEGFMDDVDHGSRIHVTPNGEWSFPNLHWNGSLDKIVVVPYNVVPVQPTLPTSLKGIATLILGQSGRTAQISDATGHRFLNADGSENRDPATRLPNASRYAPLEGPSSNSDIHLVEGTGAFVHTVTTTSGAGIASPAFTYSDTILGDGVAARVETTGPGGSSDQVTLRVGEPFISFQTQATSKSLTAKVIASAEDRSQRTILIRTNSSAQGNDEVAFDSARGVASYRHTGAATNYTVTLGWAGREGPPVAFASPTLLIASGDRATFEPSRWDRLATAPVVVTVFHSDGTATRQTLSAARIPARAEIVSVDVVSSPTNTEVLMIASKLADIAPDAQVMLVWSVLTGDRLVEHHTVILTAAEAAVKQRLDRWTFEPKTSGSFRFTGSVLVISGGSLPQSQSSSRSTYFTVGGKR